MNYARFLNAVSLARKPSPIRQINALWQAGPPSMISLAGGAPNPSLFPFKKMDFELNNGSKFTLEGDLLGKALQYAPTSGLPSVVEWIKKLQDHVHNPLRSYDVCLTSGSQEAICRTAEMLTNKGDYVIVDKPSYSGALATFAPIGAKFLDLDTDEFGTIPESLERVMSPWSDTDPTATDTNMPRVIYTIPNGVNPTGACLTEERKRKIYQLCQKYNLIILEDDPYYYLQFEKPSSSFLSMDVDGRVIRFDSFSKIVSAGMRIGVATGPSELIHRIVLHNMVSSMHCNSLSQVLLLKLFEQWDIQGFLQHTKGVTKFYEDQRDVMLACLEKHLTGLAEWHAPKAGMFFWVKLLGIEDTSDLAKRAIKHEVLFLPGSVFMTDDTQACPHIRLSYSTSTPEQIDKALNRMAELITEEQANKK